MRDLGSRVFVAWRSRLHPQTPCSIPSTRCPREAMGALEAVNGMLLFGISTAYVFAVMKVYWSMLAKYVTSSQG